MIAKNFVLSLLTLFLVFSSVSALTIDANQTINNVQHNTVISIPFVLDNTGDSANYTLIWSGTPVGRWTSLSSLPTFIDSNTTFSLSANFSIPQYQSDPMTATIIAGAGLASETFTINIASSPALSIEVGQSKITPSQNGTFMVRNTGNVEVSGITFSTSKASVSVSPNTLASLAKNTASSTFTVSTSDFSGLSFGTTNTVTVTANSGTVHSNSASFSVEKTFCKNGAAGTNLTLDRVEINSDGEDDNAWRFLDTITVEVRVENVGDNDVDDVTVELGLYDSSGVNKVGNLEFINNDEERIDLGDINDGDKEIATFEFKVPADMDSGDYKLAVKAYSKKSGESKICVDSSSDLSSSTFEEVSVEQENDEGKFMAFDNIKLTPSDVTCGDAVTLEADVYNIGDQDEDRVRINLINKELGIDSNYEIGNGLDQGDNQKITFTFDIPQSAADKTYKLALSSEYDYKNGNYRQSSDDDEIVPLILIGCSVQQSTARIASISASLESDAKAGQDMTVVATIKNLGNSTTSFIVNAKGFDSWATLNEVSPKTITLNSGESSDVTINLNVKNSAAGSESFIIEALANGKIESRTVEVSIASSGSLFSGVFKNNALVWVIGIINLVLIILIIIVAVKLSRR